MKSILDTAIRSKNINSNTSVNDEAVRTLDNNLRVWERTLSNREAGVPNFAF